MTKKEALLEQYSNYLKMRNYSEATYKAYMCSIRKFWEFCEARKDDPKFDKNNAVMTYLAYRMSVQKRHYATVNGDYSALQWFYKYILGREWNVRKLIRPKREKRLPRLLSPEQISKLIASAASQKHRILFLMYYSTGMRLSEARCLKWEDIVFDEGIINIRKGKGAKDRITVLHPELKELLLAYRKAIPSCQMLVFAGKDYNTPIAARSIQHAFINARRKAGLPKWATAHVLRHSYATNALKNKTDLLTLKELLGHKKLSTTSRYLHLDASHFKVSHNTLSHQCLQTVIHQTQKKLP